MRKSLLSILQFTIADFASWFGTLWSWVVASGAILGGVILTLIQKYLIQDIAFLPWLIIAVGCDTWAGWNLAKKKYLADPLTYPKPTWATLREKLAGKLTAIMITLITLNFITNFEINGLPAQKAFTDFSAFGWNFDLNIFKVVYFTGATFMIIVEAKSTIKNLRASGYNYFSDKLDDALDKVTGDKEIKNDGL